MFRGGETPGGRYPRQYAPRCRIPFPTGFDQPPGPSMATGFRPPGQYRPGVPCWPFLPRQYERGRQDFPQFYHDGRSAAGRGYPGCGNNQGPCGAPQGESISGQFNPTLPCAGYSVDETKVSMGIPPSHTDNDNERAGEEFLRCLAAKENFTGCERAIDRGDPHYRPPCPGKGQELGADHQVGRSKSRPRSRSRSRGKSLGRSKSRPRSRSRSRGKSVGRSKSRPRSRSRGKSVGRSKSRPRSRSRSRGKSVGRSKSRPRSRSRSRGKSVGRSKSRPRSRSRSRGKSVGRSKSRPRSRSRSQEKSLEKGRSLGLGRGPSRSCSGSSSSSSSTITIEGTNRTTPHSKKTAVDMFRELLLSGQLKERELTLSKMTTLKKQLDTVGRGQSSTQTSHSPVNILAGHQTSSLPREMQSLLSAETKGMEPSVLASIQGQMRDQPHGQRVQAGREDINMGQCARLPGIAKQEPEEECAGEFLLPHERVRYDTGGFSRILGVMGSLPELQKKKIFTDIEDEEKFLYGDEDDKGKVSGKTAAGENQAVVDFEKIKKALTTIGLGMGTAEISKMVSRTQEHQASHIAESPHLLKGVSSMGRLSPSKHHSLKRNRSPNPDICSNSHSSAKQALYSGDPVGVVRSELDASTQEKQAGEIPFFRQDTVQTPLVATNMQTSALGTESAIWGQAPLKVENSWLQKPNLPVPHTPAVHHQNLRLGPMKGVLESVKATMKASGMETLVDLANETAYGRTSQRQKNSEEQAKIREEVLKTAIQQKLKNKDYLLKELESLLKQEVSKFVVPVIGFCCKLCEEFFGDIASAQDHAACQSHKEKSKKYAGEHKSEGNLHGRLPTDKEKREQRDSEYKWSPKEDPKVYRETGEKASLKEEKLDATRQVRVVSGPSSATPSKMAERKDTDSARSSVTDPGEDRSTKAHKKKKKKKEKKKLKKEKKKEKKEKEKKEKMNRT